MREGGDKIMENNILYHGTTLENYKGIMKDGFIKCSKGIHNQVVFLTDNKKVALLYATNKEIVNVGKRECNCEGVILSVDTSKIRRKIYLGNHIYAILEDISTVHVCDVLNISIEKGIPFQNDGINKQLLKIFLE